MDGEQAVLLGPGKSGQMWPSKSCTTTPFWEMSLIIVSLLHRESIDMHAVVPKVVRPTCRPIADPVALPRTEHRKQLDTDKLQSESKPARRPYHRIPWK